MKKLALVLAATTAFTAAQANIGTGFYIGAHTGFDSVATDMEATSPLLLGGTSVNKAHMGRGNANVGLFAGYGMVNGCFYYGGELGYTFSSTKIRSTPDSTAANQFIELKRSGYFNAAVRLGYLFSQNTMGYVRLGVNWGKWNLRDTVNAGTVAAPVSASKNSASFAPGVGIETALNRNVSLRAEWTYEFGRNLRVNNAAAPTTTFTTAKSIRTSSFKLGIAYRF